MKRSLLLLTLLVLALSALSYGQFNGTGWSGGIGYGATFAKTDLTNGTRFIARGFIRKGITEKIGAEVGLGSAKIGGDEFNTLLFPLDLRVNVSPFNFGNWNPFVYGGFGMVNYKVEDKPVNAYPTAKIEGWATLIPVGAGAQFKLTDMANFEVVGGYNISNSWDLNAYRKSGTDKYWSLSFNLSSTLNSGPKDSDGDGLMDDVEAQLGTDPKNPDTDGDGLTDAQEVNTYKTNPKVADSDGDGLSDKSEVMENHTDANVADTDGDGLSDGDEVNKYHTDPLKKDTDGGSVNDGDEVKKGTDPTKASDDVPPPPPPAPAPKEEVKEQPKEEKVATIEKGQSLVLEGILFETGKSDITDASKAVLDKVISTLKEHADVNLEVQGHTDNKGKEASNRKLSQKRAESVRAYMVAQGIDGARLKAKGYGSSKPVDTNDTDEGRAKNRRIEFLRTN